MGKAPGRFRDDSRVPGGLSYAGACARARAGTLAQGDLTKNALKNLVKLECATATCYDNLTKSDFEFCQIFCQTRILQSKALQQFDKKNNDTP